MVEHEDDDVDLVHPESGMKKIMRTMSSHPQPLLQRWSLNPGVERDIAFERSRRPNGR